MILEPKGNKFALYGTYTYKDVVVPHGFKTDGISYKFRLLGIFLNKFDPRFIEAVVIHDYLTDLNQWEKANRYFEELLPSLWQKPFMVFGVKIYKKIKGY